MSRVERKAKAAEEQKRAIEERKKARKAQAKADKKIKKDKPKKEKASRSDLQSGEGAVIAMEGDGFKAKLNYCKAKAKAKWNQFKDWFMAQPRWKKIVMVTGTTIVTILLILMITVFALFNSVFKSTPDDYDLSLTAVDGYINILLLGVDSRDMDNLEGTRSDAIMMVSINEETNDVKILSVYRDTFLKMGHKDTYDKITHACSYGGPELTMRTLNQAMDVNISNYVVVNFKAVADLVDAVGGIEVDVQDYEIEQLNKYTIETANNIGRKDYKLVEKAGKQTLEGVQAVSYSRIRKGVGDDFKRTERMRTVLTLTMEKMNDLSVVELYKIVKMMTPQVQTNISMGNVLALGVRLPKYNILDTTGWPYNVTTGMINGMSCVIPNDLESNVVQMHREFFGQEDYQVSQKVQEMSDTIAQKVNGIPQEVPEIEELEDMEYALPNTSEPVGDLNEDEDDSSSSTDDEDSNTDDEDTSEGETSGSGDTTTPDSGDTSGNGDASVGSDSGTAGGTAGSGAGSGGSEGSGSGSGVGSGNSGSSGGGEAAPAA